MSKADFHFQSRLFSIPDTFQKQLLVFLTEALLWSAWTLIFMNQSCLDLSISIQNSVLAE